MWAIFSKCCFIWTMSWDASKYAGYKVTKLKPNGPVEGQEVDAWLFGKDQQKEPGRHRTSYTDAHKVRTERWREWNR